MIYHDTGLHKLWHLGILAWRKWRENEKMKRKWREKGERSLSTFPHFPFIYSLSLHFLNKKLSHFVAKF